MANKLDRRPAPGAPAPAEAPAPETTPPETPIVCRKLRTKLAFSAMVTPDGTPVAWQRGDGSTAVYWCLRTMECAGPDNGLVHACDCRPGRACFVPPEAAETMLS